MVNYSSDFFMLVITKIRNTSGAKAKKNILSEYPGLQNILRTTYNPYIRFNIFVDDRWKTNYGDKEFSDKTHTLLKDLAKGLQGTEAKKRIVEHMNELTFNSAMLFMCIINKDMRMGLAAKSINDIWPGLIPSHDIQLAKLYDANKVSFPCYVSPKIDGLRAIYKNGQLYTRNGHVFVGLNKLIAALKSNFPSDVILDGELTVEGKVFNDISGDLRSFNETDNAIYNIFDAPSVQDMLYKRLVFLYETMHEVTGPVPFKYVTHELTHNFEDLNLYAQSFMEEGYEGAMVKGLNSLYKDTRSFDWMKIKATETADCKVISTFPGRGKYAGLIGGIDVKYNDVEVHVGSGLTDQQRMTWAAEPELIIGKTVEVAYQEITPSGSLRHPRLKGIRGDK